MNITQSQAISKLLGSVSISELPVANASEGSYEQYVLYNYKYSGDTEPICAFSGDLLKKYLALRVFSVMVDTADMSVSAIRTILNGAKTDIDKEASPLQVGRYLAENKNDWIENSKTINKDRLTISDTFLSHFQYYYLENIYKQKRTFLLWYVVSSNQPGNCTVNPSMWETHIPTDKWDDIAIKPITFNGKYGNLVVKATDDGKFIKRNYSQIVNGNGDIQCDSNHDVHWGNTSFDNPINITDRYGRVTTDRIGDIDMTLRSIDKYLDDLEKSLNEKIITYPGMVIITTADNSEIGQIENANQWSDQAFLHTQTHDADEPFEQRFIYAKSGIHQKGGSDSVAFSGVQQLINHSHNTVLKNNNVINRNIAIVNYPESVRHGCIPVLDRLKIKDEKLSVKHPSDIEIESVSPDRFFGGDFDSKVPFKGGVHYVDDAGNTTDQQSHNNVPLYYNVRVLVKMS